MPLELNLVCKVVPHRNDPAPIIQYLFGEKLNEYSPSKNYSVGDIIYHYDAINKTFKFLTCIKNTTGAFKEGDWKHDPNAISNSIGSSGGLSKIDAIPSYPPYSKEAKMEVTIEAVKRIMGDARREGYVMLYDPSPASKYPFILDRGKDVEILLPEANLEEPIQTNEILVYIDYDVIWEEAQSEAASMLLEDKFKLSMSLELKNGTTVKTKDHDMTTQFEFISVDKLTTDARLLKPDSIISKINFTKLSTEDAGFGMDKSFVIVHNIAVAYSKKY